MAMPGAALEMYARAPRLIAWDEIAFRRTLTLSRALKANSRFDPKPDRVWDKALPFITAKGRRALHLNCNDFAPRLKRLLHDGGFPLEAMALAICKRPHPGRPGELQGHMILLLETDRGDYLVCNLEGLGRCDDPRWRDYEWLHREAPGRPWVSLEPAKPKGTLADYLPS
jgi:hypothetical protein